MKLMLICSAVAAVFLIVQTARAQDASQWYTFAPTSHPQPGEIGLQSWVPKPAGQLGRIIRKADKLMYNGQPIKLWGLNLCFGNCVPSKEIADRRAQFYAKFGINSVRLHKFTESDYSAGTDSAVQPNAQALDRMDYQIAKFKEVGIYVDLSVHFGPIMLGPADRKYVPYIDEIGSFTDDRGRKVQRISAEHSALFYSPELQLVHRLQMRHLLRHVNAYTQLPYAYDPAIAFLEIVNEQSIFFYSSMNPLKKYPTIRKMTAERFSDWLKKKYESQEGLLKAWGSEAFAGFDKDGFPEAGTSIDARDILPLGNPWYWDPAQLEGSQKFRKQRLLDTLQFLFELQNECYDKYVEAMRQVGYTGEIIGSNWQAGRAFSHFANLYSDSRVGTVDRHNYFDRGTMLRNPGSGLLSSGMQQVADRPFMLSEWIHTFPNEYGAEGPAILAAYGLGLQGWDASYLFQNGDDGRFSGQIGRDTWDATAPQILGLFPAIVRQIQRGDVSESDVIAPRNVDKQALFQGQLSFEDKVVQGYDQKELDSSKVPATALAAVRSVVCFTNSYEDTPTFDLPKYLQDGAIVSSTGQLRWTRSNERLGGFFTTNTDATKAVVGFAANQTLKLGDVTIRPQTRFAAVYVTARDKGKTLANGKAALIVAMARARNTGMKFDAAESKVTTKGKGPIQLEGVTAAITLARPGAFHVIALDADGRRTKTTVPVKDGEFTIDTARDKTPYYLVEFE